MMSITTVSNLDRIIRAILFQVECSNGQIGFGRKKRNVPSDDVESQRIYEVA